MFTIFCSLAVNVLTAGIAGPDGFIEGAGAGVGVGVGAGAGAGAGAGTGVGVGTGAGAGAGVGVTVTGSADWLVIFLNEMTLPLRVDGDGLID